MIYASHKAPSVVTTNGKEFILFIFHSLLNFVSPIFSITMTCCKYLISIHLWHASQVALVVKNLPAKPGDIEMWVWSLGEEDPLEKEMATHSSILAWRIPWTEEPSGLQSMGSQRVGHDWVTNTFFLSGLNIHFHLVENQCLIFSQLFHNVFTLNQNNYLNGAFSIISIQWVIQAGSSNTQILRRAVCKVYC